MNILHISIAVSVFIIVIAFMNIKETFQSRPAPSPAIPADIVAIDRQLTSLSNTLISSLRTFSTLITRRKDIEQSHIEKGGREIPHPPVVLTLLKTIQPQ